VFPPRRLFSLQLPGSGTLELGARPLIMAVLNVTPDSFAEEEHVTDPGRAVDAALRFEAEGADLVDVGGESTRPGAEPVAEAQELDRIVPVVRRLVRELRIPVSIDTYKAEVARAALSEGAAIVNDVSGLQHDPALANVVADAGSPLVLTHTRGRSKDMYASAVYGDLIAEIVSELRSSMEQAEAAGVRPSQIVVDPGLGFAKQAQHSYGVLARVQEVAAALDRPVLIGPSRKSFLREALGGLPASERDWGTAAAVTAAVLAGVHILRVHAVDPMRQVVRVAEEIRRRAPASDHSD
jgi:dihydropteroate synthase